MIKTAFFILTVILAVSGICEFIHTVILLFKRPECGQKAVSVIRLEKGNAIKQLSYAFEQLRWHGDAFAFHIIALSSDIEDIELEECRRFAAQLPITLCGLAQLEHVTEEIL